MRGRITTRNNKLTAVISLPKDEATGKYSQKVITALPYETRQELEIRMNRFIDQMQTKDVHNIKRVTFGSFLADWIKKHALKIEQTTFDSYEIYINRHIIPELGNIILNDLKPKDIETFYDTKMLTYKRRTVMHMHAIISKSLKYAFKNKIIMDNPMQYVELPKQTETFQMQPYNDKELALLQRAVSGTIDEIYVLLGAGLGMRLGEILGLKWENVDFQNQTVTICNTVVKTSHGLQMKAPKTLQSKRTISTGKAIMKKLIDWKSRQIPSSEYVVNEFNSNTYSGHFNRLLKKHGLRHIRFHDLRHFNATYMLNNGVPDKIASGRLGHSTVQTTRDIYQHVLKEQDNKAAKKLDKLFD